MFHHFHGLQHIKTQGSISGDELSSLLDYLGCKHNILDAKSFFEKALLNKLKQEDICLTFDDNLLSQFDIALPILESRGLTAFFFVYTNTIPGGANELELFRHFRHSIFSSIGEFYEEFFQLARNKLGNSYQEFFIDFQKKKYLSKFSFYTDEDRWFRYLRDVALESSLYDELRDEMMAEYQFDKLAASKDLWMTDEHLLYLRENGHVIGLHSHNHPTKITSLSENNQLDEYSQNLNCLRVTGLINETLSMAHPCGDYDHITLKILTELGVTLGFRSNFHEMWNRNLLEIPREDHAVLMQEMCSE